MSNEQYPYAPTSSSLRLIKSQSSFKRIPKKKKKKELKSNSWLILGTVDTTDNKIDKTLALKELTVP